MPRRARRGANWVCKTNVASYARCPYAFYLLDSGKVSVEDAYPQFILDRMADGVTFPRTLSLMLFQ